MSYWLGDYKLAVTDEKDPSYRSPLDPHCRPGERYMAVIAADGNWGIVDRRNGHMLMGENGRTQHYTYRKDVLEEVARLNSPPAGSLIGAAGTRLPQRSGVR